MCRSFAKTAKIHLPQSLYTDCISLKYSCGLTVPHFRHVTNTTHVSIWILSKECFQCKDWDALSRKVDSRFDIELISSESPKYFMLAISTKRKIILELLSVYDLTLAQPKKIHFTTWWPLNLNYQNLINKSLEETTVIPRSCPVRWNYSDSLYIKLPADGKFCSFTYY